MARYANNLKRVRECLKEGWSVERIASIEFYNVTRTDEELSIACRREIEIKSDRCDNGWSCIRIAGTLDLALTGILAGISDVLAKAGISIFAISTYNTDYILVKCNRLISAIAALKESGYLFIPAPIFLQPLRPS